MLQSAKDAKNEYDLCSRLLSVHQVGGYESIYSMHSMFYKNRTEFKQCYVNNDLLIYSRRGKAAYPHGINS